MGGSIAPLTAGVAEGAGTSLVGFVSSWVLRGDFRVAFAFAVPTAAGRGMAELPCTKSWV
jgi:hypothetical protein